MYRGIRKAFTISCSFLGIWLVIQYFLPLFFPFVLGTALALAAEPMVSFLCRRLKLPRGAAAGIGVTAAFCFIALALLLVVALIVRELAIVASILPDLEEAASGSISALSAWVMGLIARMPSGIGDILSRSASEFFSGSSALLDQAFRYVVNLTGGVLKHVPDSALVLGTAVISSYMISAKFPRLKAWLLSRIPKERLTKIKNGVKRMKHALFGWLKAQFKLMGITWIILTMGLVLLRIPYAPVWGAVISLVDAFPILGTGTVLLPWSLVSFLQEDTIRAVGLLAVYAVISLSRSVLEPKLVGKHLGLDPLATLAALYAGYRLWGLGGMILAPILAVAAVQVIRAPGAEGH